MKTDEIRQKYLDFFKSKAHTVCASDVLVPRWDKTVLFTPAGMNQFKDHFLGKVDLEFTRATSCQKCLRTGDIENVGRTAYHHTFFEMLGNFSFGDYFKREAIIWAWEFLTSKQWLAVDSDRLTVSVYLDDDEAANIWHKDVGLSLDRIARMGEHDNFWPAGAPTDGPDGVCGPCSEIFYHPEDGDECEIWNLVFTQFDRIGDPPDNLKSLPTTNIDTGMGLERMAATMQGVKTNFHIDTLLPIVHATAEAVGTKYDPENEDGRRLRRITDHVRACVMAIHENVYPGSQKEEYVIRRLLRRAVLQGHEMGVRDPFLFKIVPEIVHQMGPPYPELKGTAERVAQVIKSEEEGFLGSLDDGLARIESIFKKMKLDGERQVNGQEAADLYTTYGIPAELFATIAQDRALEFDWTGYQAAMDQHGIDSGKGPRSVMGNFGPIDEIKKEVKSTEFVGYETTEATGVVLGLIQQLAMPELHVVEVPESETRSLHPSRENCLHPKPGAEQFVVLDRTPFYAESGGQVGDTGWLLTKHGKFQVTDTQKNGDVIVHSGQVVEGEINSGDEVKAEVDYKRRSAIRRAHSATHVLHYALQQTLGEHAQQRGSKVTDDLLRFDFSNLTAVEPEQLSEIEQAAIQRISEGEPIVAKIVPLDEAKRQGAMMLFGEKYPDPVRMISIGEFSKELCGGTHLDSINQVAAFEIISEESVSAGTRRIQALTGDRAVEHQNSIKRDAEWLADKLNVSVLNIPQAVVELSNTLKSVKKQVSAGKKQEGADQPTQENPRTQCDTTDYFAIRNSLKAVASFLNVPLDKTVERVAAMTSEVDELRSQLESLQESPTIDVEQLIAQADEQGGIQLIVADLPNASPAVMRQLIDQIRKKISPVAVFFATSPGASKVLLAAGISRDLIERGFSAGDWIKAVAPIVGGGGGGKPDLAQAGGKKPENIGMALEKAAQYLWAKSSV